VEHVVIWRSGGTANFKWHRSTRMSKTAAEALAGAVRTGGRVAHVERADRSEAIGLPETFEAGTIIEETGVVD
jgi:hypothetical protein